MIQEKEFKINENGIALSERKYQRHRKFNPTNQRDNSKIRK